jgi:hypothetical protein
VNNIIKMFREAIGYEHVDWIKQAEQGTGRTLVPLKALLHEDG